MAFGVIDTKYIDLPPGIDADYLNSLQTRSGIEMADLVRLVDAAMADLNTGVDPLVAALTAPTVNPVAGRRRTTVKRAHRGGEYTMDRPQRGASAAHMLPITDIEIALGFTEKGLQKISRESFTEELDSMVEAIRILYLVETLVRLFDPAEVPVDDDTDVMSPGFAGSGTGTNVFKGIFPDGTATPGGYTHYGVATQANMAAAIKTYRNLVKRWIPTGPYDGIPSQAMFDAMVGDTANFVPVGSPLIRLGANANEATVDANVYAGVYMGDIRVRYPVLGLGSTKHLAIVKSYGAYDARNPLVWRYDELVGRDAYVRSRELYPLANAQVMQSFGIGVNNRVGAALLMIDEVASSYAAPTINY